MTRLDICASIAISYEMKIENISITKMLNQEKKEERKDISSDS